MPAPPDPLPPDVLQDAAATFGLLSATVRLHLLWLLADGESDVGTLADGTGQSVATVSHHLGKLKLAGLVRARREGKHQIHYVDDPHVVEMIRIAVDHHRELRAPRRRRRSG
ncbi:metalloregulator ArsR/SmtB family transcription factor [Amycolatopsis mongoliensis]|uniref:Metalloregulator ArsR/SmtB family transcription factor n=1 Tax=Amycolatopsis mongoliensis TaxID=715475 RepID=A0A9Y2JHM5_9PSEU|nr:metalloregulator ArsR/SmtB family transcription factor [Amycolatopsis sp. 4-36]WIX98795.1 metalloregulator ArsR/SmtB family transcription factor [Amycolatopsis sp. 4-36]